MKTTLPAGWLLILIAGVALWTDVDHLTRTNQTWQAFLFAASILGLAGSLFTFALGKVTVTKVLFTSGVALAFLGTFVHP